MTEICHFERSEKSLSRSEARDLCFLGVMESFQMTVFVKSHKKNAPRGGAFFMAFSREDQCLPFSALARPSHISLASPNSMEQLSR
uniref:Uncharacterized protein n=1 Tax=Candidatus Kentrum sp. DK TaxID=2126562 RepID=A0A450SMH1_9GAMM|nr:MAG: hypothetical protein BECKDK2373C_GA0170839_104613 [Candidatus Kentron sp. DK]